MLRTVGWISWMFGYLFVLLPFYWRTRWLRSQGRMEEFTQKRNRHVKTWARKLLRHVGVEVLVEGAENVPPPGVNAVYVVNHQSFLDIPILLGYMGEPHGLLAKKEIGMVPLLRGWMGLLGCLYVDRDDLRSGIEALKKAEAYVKEGHSFIIFPEGTRAQDGVMGEFKGGAVRIASKAGVPVVPVLIDGSYKGLEYNGFRLRRCKVRLSILPAIQTKDLSRAEQKELPARLEGLLREEQAEGASPAQPVPAGSGN